MHTPILVVLNPEVKGGCCGRWLVSWEGEGSPVLVPGASRTNDLIIS